MSIGLKFVKGIDKQWKKHIQSLDLQKEDEEKTEKIYTTKETSNYNTDIDLKDENSEWDYWEYWKKKYTIRR